MRRSLTRLALAMALGACAAPPPARHAPPSRAFESVALHVSNLEVGPPDRLEIAFDGAMRLVRVAGVPPAGIGLFETRLRPDELRALTRGLQDVATLPDHWGRIVPDDRVRRVLVTWARAPAVEKAVGTTEPVDPRLAVILDRLEALMRRTGEHPRQTIGLTLGEVVLGPGRTLVATAQLTATGTAAVQAPSLVALLGDQGALGLRLEGAHERTEIPVLDVRGPPGPLIRLEPGRHTALFTLVAAPPPTPIFERASLVVRWDGAGADVPIAGELSSPAVPIGPAPTASPPIMSDVMRGTAPACAFFSISFDRRALPTSTSPAGFDNWVVGEADDIRRAAPGGASLRMYTEPGLGHVNALFDGATDEEVLARCERTVAAYLPTAPNLPLIGLGSAAHVTIPCRRCD